MSATGSTAETLIAAAGLRLNGERPYLSAALWSIQRIATDMVPTMAVDAKWRLYYNPAVVTEWSVEEVMGVLYHEICHLIREHAHRCPAEEQGEDISIGAIAALWNLATDAEINDDIRAEEIALPGSPIYPETIKQHCFLTAEEYYDVLRKQWRQAPALFDLEAVSVAAGRCGSCAGGDSPAIWESSEVAASVGLPGITSTDAMLVRRSVAVAVREHAQRSRGSVPGQWLRWADEHFEPRVDWRAELAAQVRHALGEVTGAVDYRYSRPARRQSCFPTVVVPSLRQPVPSVAVVIDTSGSVSDTMLSEALAEVSGILKASGLRDGVTVLAVDAAVQTCRRVFSARQVELSGGGGTDMGVGIEAASRLKPPPDVAIVITDGFTPWPPTPPRSRMRTVVLLTDERGTSPSWAKTIALTPSDRKDKS